MDLLQAFPVAIIDEDYNGENAAGRGMRMFAAAIEKEGYRVVGGINYEDARQLVNVFNTEACWLVSVDGAEDKQTKLADPGTGARRQAPQERPPADFPVRRRMTAEMVPAERTETRQRLHAAVRGFARVHGAGDCPGGANYLDRLPPPMFKALMDYTLHAGYSWHTPGHGGGVAFRKSPVGQLFYQFFGENMLRADISVSVGALGSLLDHTGPIAAGERNAARIFGADETLFVIGGTSTANKIVWHGTVGRGDIVLCDRNCHKSILHSLIMTGATPVFLTPTRNGLGIIGPIPRDQFTPASDRPKDRREPVRRARRAARSA